VAVIYLYEGHRTLTIRSPDDATTPHEISRLRHALAAASAAAADQHLQLLQPQRRRGFEHHGANRVIDYMKADFSSDCERYSSVLNAVGK
jgi:hypothetical protein